MGNKQGIARKGLSTRGGAGEGKEEEKEGGVEYDIPASVQRVTVDDFDLLKVLGKGSFGKVMLVKKKTNGQQ